MFQSSPRSPRSGFSGPRFAGRSAARQGARPALRAAAFLALMAGLSACATPQERCIRDGSRPVDRILSDIRRVEGNIERGYAIHRQTVPRTYFFRCHHPDRGYYTCPRTEWETIEQAVPIDVAEQRKTLEQLKRALEPAQQRANEITGQCRSQFPE